MSVNDQDESTGPVAEQTALQFAAIARAQGERLLARWAAEAEADAEPSADDPNYRDDWDDRSVGRSAGPRPRKADGASVVYSIRLGPEEVAELQRRAEVVSLPPTMLARQFIRAGLHAQDDVDGEDETVSALSDRLVRDSAALHRILGAGAR